MCGCKTGMSCRASWLFCAQNCERYCLLSLRCRVSYLTLRFCFQVAQFNHSHTVADIRRFIAASRPDLPAAYNLMTAFPSAQLTDDSKTISDAGLLNAVIIQKM